MAASFLAKQKSSQIASVPKPTGSSVKLPTATASGSGTAVKTTSSGSATLKFSPAAVASRLATGTSVIKSGSSVMASSGGIKSTSTTGSTNASHVASVIKKPTLVGGKSTPAASATPMTNANKKLQQMKKAAEKRAFKP